MGFFFFDDFNKAAFHVAVEKGHLDIVNLLISNKKLDINLLCV